MGSTGEIASAVTAGATTTDAAQIKIISNLLQKSTADFTINIADPDTRLKVTNAIEKASAHIAKVANNKTKANVLEADSRAPKNAIKKFKKGEVIDISGAESDGLKASTL